MLAGPWVFLESEADLADRADGANLCEYRSQEQLYEEIPAVGQATSRLAANMSAAMMRASRHEHRRDGAALDRLQAMPGWASLESAQQVRMKTPVEQRAAAKPMPRRPYQNCAPTAWLARGAWPRP